MYFVTSVKICTMTIKMSEQSRSQLYIYEYSVLPLLLCVAILLLLLQHVKCCCFPLLFAIVCRMAKFGAGPLNLILAPYSSSFKRELLLMHPLAVLYHICGLDLPTSSVITGMRGANAGVSPPRRSPLCVCVYMPLVGSVAPVV